MIKEERKDIMRNEVSNFIKMFCIKHIGTGCEMEGVCEHLPFSFKFEVHWLDSEAWTSRLKKEKIVDRI